MVGAVPRADGKVVLGVAVGAADVCGVFDVDVLDGYGLWYCYLDVAAVAPAVKRCSSAVVLHRDQSNGADVQEFEVLAGAQRNGETALLAGEGLALVADLKEPPVGDGQAEWSFFAGAVSQCTAMGADVPLLGSFAVGDGLGDPLLSFISCLPHPLVGLPGFRCTLLVDVIGRGGLLAVALLPRGDADRCAWADLARG